MKEFIEVEAIMQLPGNPKTPMLIKVSSIETVTNAPADAAQIGASTSLSVMHGGLYVTQSFDEVKALIEEAMR